MKSIPVYQKHRQQNKKLNSLLPSHDDRTPFIYFLINRNKIVYIGKSESVRLRIHHHNCYIKYNKIRLIPCRAKDMTRYERRWIAKFRPIHNVQILAPNLRKIFIERIS